MKQNNELHRYTDSAHRAPLIRRLAILISRFEIGILSIKPIKNAELLKETIIADI